MKSIGVILILLFFSLRLDAQIVESENNISMIKEEVEIFLRKNKILNDDYTSIFITEILHTKLLGYNEIGIYIFGTHISHTPRFILLKEQDKFLILDPTDDLTASTYLLEFLEKNITSQENRINYKYYVYRTFSENLKYNLKKTDYKHKWIILED